MEVVKRVEIITGTVEFPEVESVLKEFGVTGYVVHKDVIGRGDRRVDSPDLLTGGVVNRMIQTTCAPHQFDGLIKALRPILKRYGGACIVYDAQVVVH